jgi:hypothetical protein
MRSAVKKPDIKPASILKAQTRTDLPAKVPEHKIAPKISYAAVNKTRHQRAARMIKSPAVSRYGDVSDAPVHQAGASVSVLTESEEHHRNGHIPVAAQQVYEKVPDIFEQAVAHATSHEQTYQPERKSKRRARAIGLVGASVLVLLLVGVISYFNTANISLAVASYRAGVHAKLPAKELEGFDFGSLDYEPGNVVINFTSPEDSRQYNITQQTSSWDSQALLSNFVTSVGDNYKTYQKAGRTVYLVGNNVATWVDSGVWYTVDGNSSLDSNQVLELASSM